MKNNRPTEAGEKFWAGGKKLTVKSFHGDNGTPFQTASEAILANDHVGGLFVTNVEYGGTSPFSHCFIDPPNARPVPIENIPGLAEVIGRTGSYADYMAKELVLRCTNHDCNQVLQVGADQMQAFVVTPDGVLCKACELLMNRNNPKT